MKNNYIKYIMSLFTLFSVLSSKAQQVIFFEDFGTITGNDRRSSIYVIQGGLDANLGVFSHGSSFYRFGKYNSSNPTPANGSIEDGENNVRDGHYAIINPNTTNNTELPSWFRFDKYDHTIGNSGAKNGAAMLVNCGHIFNQYYRRSVSLNSGRTYKVSIWINNLNTNAHKFKIEVQNVLTETILGQSPEITTAAPTLGWQEYTYTFKMPDSNQCSEDVAISFRNMSTEISGNDILIDDIKLEEVINPNSPVISCTNIGNELIKANNNVFTFEKNKSFDILSNDLYIDNGATQKVIVSGTTPNATIEKIGVWPIGYSILNTGELQISDSATHVATLAYKITSTQDPTKSSTATIFLNAIDLSVSLAVTNPYVTTYGTYHEYTLKIKNTGNQSIVLSPNNKVSIFVPQAVGASGNFDNPFNSAGSQNDWTWTISSSNYTFNYPDTRTITLAVGEEKSISFSRDYHISSAGSGDGARSITAKLTYYLDYFEPNNTSNATIRRAQESITTSHDSSLNPLCYGASLVLTHNQTGGNSKYIFEYSYDGGLTWVRTAEQSSNTYELSPVTGNVKVRSRRIIAGVDYYSIEKLITVTANNEITFPTGINSIAVPLGQSVNLPEITTTYKSAVTYSKVGDTSTVSPTNIMLPLGYHEYFVKATTVASGGNANNNIASDLGCETTAIIKVIVYDPKECDVYTKRTFATLQNYWSSGLSGVANPEQAVPDTSTGTINRANAATLTGGLVLLGIGTVGVDLYFTKPDGSLYSGAELKGKKVVVKLGEQYSGLKLAGGISLIPRLTRSGVTSAQIQAASTTVNQGTALLPYLADNNGKTVGVKGGVLDVLKGDNVFEFSFIPSKSNGELTDFNGVRIQMGSLLAVADLASVFYAYIEEEGEIVDNGATGNNVNLTDYCTMLSNNVTVSPPPSLLYPTNQRDVDASWIKGTGDSPIVNTNIKLNPFIEDASWGNYSEVLNVASSLSSIVFPYYALDTDYDSYTLFNATAGVLNRQFLKAKLKQQARPGDQVQITIAYPNINVLNLSLLQLGNFKIVYYLNGAVVGEEELEKFRVLDLGLFRFRDKRRAVLSRPVNFVFDTVELQQFNTVSVNLGDGLHIHDIRINPLRAFVGMSDPKQVTQLCVTDALKIQKPDACTGYEISLARVTEYGPAYQNADGSPMLDYKGNPIKSIYAIEDIPNSTLKNLGVDTSGFISLFDLDLNKLFVGPDYDGKLLIKIQTLRQGCNYGEAQYLRVDITNCIDGGIVNPVIKSGADY